MKKFLLLPLIMLIPVSVGAANMTASEADSMVTEMKTILDQYALKIRALEAENAVLREEVRKAGIQIPLSAYSGAIIQTATPPSTPTTPTTSSTNTGTTTTVVPTVSTGTGLTASMIESLKTSQWARYAGFITRIHTEWSGIRSAYKLPTTAYIGGYEFVKQGADNHAFVDIVYTTPTASGFYDAKILYEYNTGTYQRKLVWFFEFDKTTGFYKTKSGNNPFAWVARTFVRDPLAGTVIVPTTAIGTPTTSTGTASTTVTGTTKIPTFAEIEKAYSDKRYLSVISLSNTYLTANTATYDLLRIRYRTYFIIGKYSEALSEIAKIESMGKMTSTVACDAQVIATYSKDTALITKYTAACKK
jgi:hypothetical protein